MHLPEGLLDAIRREVETAYLLDRSGRIVFLNDAWDRFARAHAAPERVHSQSVAGTPWLEGIHGRVRRYYAALLGRAFSLERGTRPRALVHLGECNTPSRARTQVTRFIPLYLPEDVTARWMLVSHRIVAETPIDARHPPVDAALERYRDPQGQVTQCGCCRRLEVAPAAVGRTWEFVPALVASPPPQVRQGLCRDCFESWYGLPQLDLFTPGARSHLGRALQSHADPAA